MNLTNHIVASINGCKESKSYLKSIKKGIYIVMLKPNAKIVDISKKETSVESSQIVIKPGKFKNDMEFRFLGSKGYNDTWRYENGSHCLSEVSQVYLIKDLSTTTYEYESTIETYLNSVVLSVFDDSKRLKGTKEYYIVDCDQKCVEDKINKVKVIVSNMIEEDKRSGLRNIIFNLHNLEI